MKLHIYSPVDELLRALADHIETVAQKAIAAHGQFNFVLSGGDSPRRLYELLASTSYKDKIDWSHTYFFFGDERFVPENDPERNSLMAKKALFEPLNIEASHILKVDTAGSPEESAEKYYQTIAAHFKEGPMQFDLILLGLGGDAHTASLFPSTPVLEEKEAGIRSVFLKEKDVYRITMTAPLINQAKHIAFLAFGEGKAEALTHVMENKNASSTQYPARLIQPKSGEVHWFLDTEASSLLKQKE